MQYLISLIPVLLFLMLLYFLDSYKLVRFKTLSVAFISGALIAVSAYFINTWFINHSNLSFDKYSRFVSPVLEEILKASIIIFLIQKKKIGFLIDAGIYGFSIGAGFAVLENIYYLNTLQDNSIGIWIVRGLGTSIMHCGATALFAILSIGALNLEKNKISGIIPGITIAIATHSVFNNFYVQPYIQTLIIIILIPLLLIIIFKYNETQLKKWLEIEFFNEAELLNSMKKGVFSQSKSGKYLASLKEHFSSEIIVDMYCYISVYLELSIKSKRNLLLAECELPIVKEPDIDSKLKEFHQLRKIIGKSGELALSPLIKLSNRDFWKLSNF